MRINRKALEKYKFDLSNLNENGSLTFPTLHKARIFTQKINKKRDLINFPELAVRASEINGMTLESEIISHIIDTYEKEKANDLKTEIITWLEEKIGKEKLDKTLEAVIEEFPPPKVYSKEIDGEAYRSSNKDALIHSLIDIWLSNTNNAFSNYLELIDDSNIEKNTEYLQIAEEINDFFETKPVFGPENQRLLEMLQSIPQKHPHSIRAQLEYILEKWDEHVSPFRFRILLALDFFREEEKMRGLGPGEAQVYEYDFLPENYTPDREWMPKVCMLAKNIYVWLNQLSKKYKREINKLHQIPDEEIDRIAKWGFNALWLIGLWERSPASKTIKKWCGNPEAEASAYSLYDYIIANDLGGEESYQNLKSRSWRRGIQLASDMVPNHTGIDSKWMDEHPDWYISLSYSPFPSYSFSGQSLSRNPGIGIYLEDHYFSRSDAAVTFKWVNHKTGETRYIYHGNDGTSMPWNDTAQLNYLKPEVREAVIQTILHVARKFSIIRFDAAMTLTKKHYHRLWFPAPGSGGDIPSRAEHGLTREEFDKAMPQEFWREVVERITQEAPDTLLLAEAFWLLEGFFVRTLGMHRVYNSAFMNMLRDEDNAKYRSVMKNTLEYDPKILKRFVNFMNNPDEETAVNQFGKGDKYFGICLLLITMPGLPMFGHGQIEGFSEKYGMEYRRAYWNENPDEGFIQHHENIIFPIMKKRHLFAEVHNFLLYDFFTAEGYVNEDVFVYSNASDNERALVVYHNKFDHTTGWIRISAAFAIKTEEKTSLIQKSLGEGLNLHNEADYFCVFRDHIKGLQYIRNSREIYEKGLFVELDAYQSIVFIDFNEVKDNEFQHYAHLHDFLGGRGVINVEEALKEYIYQPIHQTISEIVNIDFYKDIIAQTKKEPKMDQKTLDKIQNNFQKKAYSLMNEIAGYTVPKYPTTELISEISVKLISIIQYKKTLKKIVFSDKDEDLIEYLGEIFPSTNAEWGIILSYIFIHLLGKISEPKEFEFLSRSWIDDWGLNRIIERVLRELSDKKRNIYEELSIVKILVAHQNWYLTIKEKRYPEVQILRELLSDLEIQSFIQINRYQDILWFNKETFSILIKWLFFIVILEIISGSEFDPRRLHLLYNITKNWIVSAEEAKYQLEKLFITLRKSNLKEISKEAI